ncbi:MULTISPECIES: hypothetical protein [unclassified Oleiphilus]|nr:MULTISPECIES: hypothetical protein [unclassified Oleiphilus]KZY40159.1 hypothetical protein A3732_20475 [Oleiphilus sp. HI0050]KZY73601.1 hypothetical protein A3740_18645 [Oleiphilus sp. HI0068]KZY79536.1 hypothetical protein A3741_06770 [Oleiphilus sp. HI0069]KZY96581.1 hypothetical protein A3743_04500 [Oleiphilus sp. HI0072]KZZ16840.1 hypothetical protein A3749_23170 [Oleiphilus sp. HI0078]KZZ29257.1 hypothetical protein A3752_03315 [Oleiphilus sp. HI0081]KZZ34187.1 hypothetical protein
MNLIKLRRIKAISCLISVILLLMSPFAVSKSNQDEKRVETLSEVSIIGSSELPNVSFDLPWKLPTIEKRDEASPPKSIPGILDSIEPVRFRQQIHFSRFLEVDSPSFKPR